MKLNDYMLITPTSTKAISASQWNNEALWREQGTETRGARIKQSDIDKSSKYKEAIGTLYRCIDIRAATIASLPFTILRSNEVVVDSNNAWEDPEYEWVDGIQALLSLTESSLLMSSQAFWFNDWSLTHKLVGLRWLAPLFVDPVYNEDAGITGFRRNIGKGDTFYTPEQITYFYIQNPMSELLPDVPQVIAAANSADVILNYEEFVRKFYERGAVRSTILSVSRDVPPKERARLKEWWENFMSGKKNAHTTQVVSSDVDVNVVGESAGDSEKTEILTSRKRDITTTLGVPDSLLFGNSTSSYTAAPTEAKNFLQYTIIPRAKLIQAVLNKSIFKPQGLYLKFSVDNLPAFKDSGEIASKIFTTYTNALMPHSVSAQLAGISLPEGIEYADLDKFAQEERDRQFKEKERIVTLNSKLTPEGQQAKPKGEDNNVKVVDEKVEEVKKYRKWLRNRKDSDIEFSSFRSDVLSDDEKLEIYKSELGGQDGNDTPFSSIKALVTVGNQDGEEPAEVKELEEKHTAAIAAAFALQLRTVFAKGEDMTEQEFMQQFDVFWGEYAADLQNYILTMELDFADLGVANATGKIKSLYPLFNPEESSYEARAWATQRAGEAFLLIQESSKRRAKSIFDQFRMGTGLTLAWILAELVKFVNASRAEAIALNEGQVVMRRAEEIVYKNAQVVKLVRYVAMDDGLTCGICKGRHGRVYPLGYAPQVPVHSRCRCFYLPIIDTRDVNRMGVTGV